MNAAMQRINLLLDKDSFRQIDDLEPSIQIICEGKINKRKVYCYAGRTDVKGANIIDCFHRKIAWLESVLKKPAPIIWLHDAPPQMPGGRTPIPAHSDELLASEKFGVGRSYCLQARIGKIVPQFSATFGDLGAALTFPFRLADFTVMIKGTHLWIGRPDAVKLMLGKAPEPEKLGGAEMHSKISGVCDVMVENEQDAINWIKKCFSCIPEKSSKPLPVEEECEPEFSADKIKSLIPRDLNKPFDIFPVIKSIIDADSWVGVRELYAKEVATGFARIKGIPAGIIANNSAERGGIIFPESCRKMTGFIKFCDAYNIPIIFMADNPGMMVGEACEQAGMLNDATELIKTLATVQTKRICLIIRKAYTVGLYAMSGPGFEPFRFFATPDSSISVFGPKALDYFASDREITPAAAEAISEMKKYATDPHNYESHGYLSGVVEWNNIRKELGSTLNEIIKDKK